MAWAWRVALVGGAGVGGGGSGVAINFRASCLRRDASASAPPQSNTATRTASADGDADEQVRTPMPEAPAPQAAHAARGCRHERLQSQQRTAGAEHDLVAHGDGRTSVDAPFEDGAAPDPWSRRKRASEVNSRRAWLQPTFWPAAAECQGVLRSTPQAQRGTAVLEGKSRDAVLTCKRIFMGWEPGAICCLLPGRRGSGQGVCSAVYASSEPLVAGANCKPFAFMYCTSSATVFPLG